MQNNDRTNERSRLIYSLRVFDDNEELLMGTVVDITPDGVMIRGLDALPVGREYSLRMGLPTIDSSDDYVKFTARTKWCRENKSGDHYNVGFQFVKITNEVKTVILRLIRNYCRDDEEGDPISDMNPPLFSLSADD
jgi:hypothetical protein